MKREPFTIYSKWDPSLIHNSLGSNANYDRWLRDSVLLSLSIKFYVNIHVLFCLTFVSILDWVMRGWSCLSHLCTILMGHSDIVEVIIFFKPSQCSYHIFTHWAGISIVQNLLNSLDSSGRIWWIWRIKTGSVNLVDLINLYIPVT